MLILALDTTTRAGSVALVRDAAVLALLEGDAARTHGERLPGELARVLDLADVGRADVDLLAVAAGPGAFTGLRIGLAAMQGLATTLARPVVGVSTLDALAHQARGEPVDLVAPWMDAQRGEVFAALYAAGETTPAAPAAAGAPETLLAAWHGRLTGRGVLFLGDAISRDARLLRLADEPRWRTRAPAPLAPDVAALARLRFAAGHPHSPHALEPVYVRRPDAEIARRRAGEG